MRSSLYVVTNTTWRFKKFLLSFGYCPQNILTPPWRALLLATPQPPGISILGVLVIPPPPPPLRILLIFQLGWVPCGKNVCVKNVIALFYYRKENFFCDKMRKKI